MKKWVATAVLMSLITGSLLSGVSVTPAMGATTTMKRNSQVSKPVQKPVHDMVVFNDYQVVGLNAGGGNWVKNDEFILPPETALDIDLIQTTYGSGTNVNRREVFLDGAEMNEYQGETSGAQSALRWQVPRFTIPANMLSPGLHTLTFVVSDAMGQKSTVNIRFQVEAQNYPRVYEGEHQQGATIPSGSAQSVFGMFGSKVFSSSVTGKWRLTNKTTEAVVKTQDGLVFSTGTLMQGQYDLLFTPDDVNLTPWLASVQVGLAEVYMGQDANGQKLSTGQRITANAAPSTVQLFSPVPGRWWVDGTGQTLAGAQNFDVVIPEQLAGMTISVTFEPTQDGSVNSSQTPTNIPIQIPGTPIACDSATATATMDVLAQRNERSSLTVERENLFSSDITIKLYQNPVYNIWLTTAADHMKNGSLADDGEGPGVWAVDNTIVDSDRLNWDNTGLHLSSYGVGRHKINYYSKKEPKKSWCGYIQIVEDAPPISSAPACDAIDRGEVPARLPMRLHSKSGKDFVDGDQLTVTGEDDLKDLQDLSLLANHVENKGLKKIKKDTSTKKAPRSVYVANLKWEFGKVTPGTKQKYGSANIVSENEVEVIYDGDEVISTIRARGDEEDQNEDIRPLDLKAIIERDGRAGEYTVKVTNTMSYQTCQINSFYAGYTKDLDMVEIPQTLTFTVEVNK